MTKTYCKAEVEEIASGFEVESDLEENISRRHC